MDVVVDEPMDMVGDEPMDMVGNEPMGAPMDMTVPEWRRHEQAWTRDEPIHRRTCDEAHRACNSSLSPSPPMNIDATMKVCSTPHSPPRSPLSPIGMHTPQPHGP